jgi:hypothetical protein
MEYSEPDAINDLCHALHRRYCKKDIRDIHRIINDLLDQVTGDGKYAFHYNKYTIIISCLKKFYKDYPHGKEIVHSYSSYISEQLHKIRQEELRETNQNNRRSFFCKYCIIC